MLLRECVLSLSWMSVLRTVCRFRFMLVMYERCVRGRDPEVYIIWKKQAVFHVGDWTVGELRIGEIILMVDEIIIGEFQNVGDLTVGEEIGET